ncbi:MAG: hypothetical protein Q9191_004432 [Dirinaria sp. TL-2023a]
MHQHPRPSPVIGSPATSSRTTPTRSNNPREEEREVVGAESERRAGTPDSFSTGARAQEVTARDKDSMTRLDQVVQNYFTKAALIILQARVTLPPAFAKGSNVKRVNKWFNVELGETEAIRDDLQVWKSCGSISARPPTMVIETYLDTEDLTNNQSLALVDELGRRWDVEEALNASPASSGGSARKKRSEVTLERWQVKLNEPLEAIPQNLSSMLPRVYRNSIVLYRSLFTYAKLLPAWQFCKKASKGRSSQGFPKLKYRILAGSRPQSRTDTLLMPLFDHHGDVVEEFSFDPIDSPAGLLSIHVTYRYHCDFRIVDSEALLSSHFMGMDDQFFEPSLGPKPIVDQPEKSAAARKTEVGSLPPQRGGQRPRPDHSQAYGSLSTFHQVGPQAGSSPLSALREAGDMGRQSPIGPASNRPPSNTSLQGSKSSLRSTEGAPKVGRRPSVSFMPFKTPSLSASPSQAEQANTATRPASVGRASALSSLAEARAPATLSPHGSVPSRGSPNMPPVSGSGSGSSSPKPAPAPRYTSSFGHRKAKLSTGGSKTEDDNSSGKTSLTSSAAQPGSGVLAEGGGSSGSIHTDDDNISDFLKMLDRKKDLKSFRASKDQAVNEAATRRTSAALTKFQQMRESNAALSDSMSSSLLLHRSSTSSSRQLSSVPPMIAGTSTSTSSSPGKPISPHTPHTPAIPSRLSANSIIEYPRTEPRQVQHARRERRPSISRDSSTGAIDIPTSPRPFHPSYRRSSSVAQQSRALPVDDDLGDIFPFGLRSASLGTDDRPQLTLSELAGLTGMPEGTAVEDPVPEDSNEGRQMYGPLPRPDEHGCEPMARQPSSSLEGRSGGPLRGVPYRPRIGRASGSRQDSLSSLGERGSGSESSDQRSRRYSSSRPSTHALEEGEPLLFAMSDFGAVAAHHQQGRRSLEEANRGGGGGGDSAGSSRRASRRGGY